MDQKARSAEVSQYYKEKKEKRKLQLGKDEDYYKAKRTKPESPPKIALKRKGSLANLASKKIGSIVADRALQNKSLKHAPPGRVQEELKKFGIKADYKEGPGVYKSKHMPPEVKKDIVKKTNTAVYKKNKILRNKEKIEKYIKSGHTNPTANPRTLTFTEHRQ